MPIKRQRLRRVYFLGEVFKNSKEQIIFYSIKMADTDIKKSEFYCPLRKIKF